MSALTHPRETLRRLVDTSSVSAVSRATRISRAAVRLYLVDGSRVPARVAAAIARLDTPCPACHGTGSAAP